MRWMKRGMWVAAWGAWVWLGFGLYRELPRDPGPILNKLSPPTDWYYLPPASGLVVGRKQQNGDVLVWQARTGELVRTIPCSDRRAIVSSRHCLLVAAMKRGDGDTYSSLDFNTAKWTDLNVRPGKILHIHPHEPWAAVLLEEDRSPFIAVVDLRSGGLISRWKADSPRNGDPADQIRAWYFLGGKEVAVVLESKHDDGMPRRQQRLERWTLDGDQLSAPVTLDPPFDTFADEPAVGRAVATRVLGTGFSYHVLDLRSGQTLLDGDLVGEVPHTKLTPSPPQLSADGRMLLTAQGELWRIDDARLMWSPRDLFESISTHVSSDTSFPILEQWNKLAERWPATRSLLSRPTMTIAVRDFDSGAVRYRTWLPYTTQKFMSDELGLGVAMRENAPESYEFSFGTVAHPPAVNLPLILLCQTILALPLILLWTTLRWRRNRWLRMAEALT
jgi:hypothetical protein